MKLERERFSSFAASRRIIQFSHKALRGASKPQKISPMVAKSSGTFLSDRGEISNLIEHRAIILKNNENRCVM